MVKNYTATLLAVLWLCVIKAKVSTSIEVTISPRCFGRISSCRTLSTVPTATNLILTFQPGEHILASSIVLFQHKQLLELKGSGRASIVCTTSRRRYNPNIRLSQNSKVKISGLTFSGCNIQFIQTNNTALRNTNFIDGANGAFQFSNSYNVTIDKSNFNNNIGSSFSNTKGIEITRSNFSGCNIRFIRTNNTAMRNTNFIDGANGAFQFSNSYNVTIDKSNFNNNTGSSFSNTKGIEITRSNFSNNRASYFSGVIRFFSSTGSIGCTNFHDNSANSYGGVVSLASGSALYVSNSTFKNSTLSSRGGVIHLDSTNDNVIVVSSVFMDSVIGYGGGVINLDAAKSSATLISSKFISTWYWRYSSSIGSAVYSDSTDVIIDCCEFINSTVCTMTLVSVGTIT